MEYTRTSRCAGFSVEAITAAAESEIRRSLHCAMRFGRDDGLPGGDDGSFRWVWGDGVRRGLVEQAAAEVFELAEELAGGEAGDAGLAYGGDAEARGGDAGDVRAESAVKLGALPLVLFADAGFRFAIATGAAGTGFAVDTPAFFERANGSAFAGDGGFIEAGEADVESNADQIIFKEEPF